MYALTVVSDTFYDLGRVFHGLADTASDVPVIGNWASSPMYDAAIYCYRVSINLSTVNNWIDSASSSIANFLTWDSIRLNILGAWTWLDTIDDKIRDVAIDKARSIWTWLDSIDDKIRDVALAKIRSTWSWIDTIDDKIRDVAWDYISERLWDFFEFAAPKVARTAYRVLSFVWNLEWDDEEKEVKQ